MKTIQITREACCSADDQTNPLTLTIEVSESESLEKLVGRITSQRFLQFSSTHLTITGFASGKPIVKVRSRLLSTRAEFWIAPETTVAVCLQDDLLDFAWGGIK